MDVRGVIASVGLLVLRVSVGGMMLVGHGAAKIRAYEEMAEELADPLGIIPTPYAYFALVGAEVVCAGLILIGLGTRFAAVPLIYAMGVAAFVVHAGDPTFLGGDGAAKEPALMYLFGYVTLLLTGPGQISLDELLFARRREPST